MKRLTNAFRKRMDLKRLETIHYSDCQVYVPPIRYGKVVKVYDGDTITVAVILNKTIYRFSIRLQGIDTPELRSKNPDEKRIAQEIQQHLSLLILHQFVDIQCTGYDKYGRILANVSLNGLDISSYLIERRMAVSYDGATKTFVDWSAYYYIDYKKS